MCVKWQRHADMSVSLHTDTYSAHGHVKWDQLFSLFVVISAKQRFLAWASGCRVVETRDGRVQD